MRIKRTQNKFRLFRQTCRNVTQHWENYLFNVIYLTNFANIKSMLCDNHSCDELTAWRLDHTPWLKSLARSWITPGPTLLHFCEPSRSASSFTAPCRANELNNTHTQCIYLAELGKSTVNRPARFQWLVQSCPLTDFQTNVVLPRRLHLCKPSPRQPRLNHHQREACDRAAAAVAAQTANTTRQYQKQRDHRRDLKKLQHARHLRRTKHLFWSLHKRSGGMRRRRQRDESPACRACRPRFKFRRPITAQYCWAWPAAAASTLNGRHAGPAGTACPIIIQFKRPPLPPPLPPAIDRRLN